MSISEIIGIIALILISVFGVSLLVCAFIDIWFLEPKRVKKDKEFWAEEHRKRTAYFFEPKDSITAKELATIMKAHFIFCHEEIYAQFPWVITRHFRKNDGNSSNN